MSTATLDRNPFAKQMSSPSAKRSSLARLYFIRGLLAVAWAAIFARVHHTLDALAIALLVAYPLIDAVSSLIDYRTVPGLEERRITAFNGMLSTVAAIAMGTAGLKGPAAALAVFGVWAVVAGAAQFGLGLRRRGPDLGRQWPMLIAGALSFLVGITYGIQAAGTNPSLRVLCVYATGGGVFFIVQAALLTWRARQRHPLQS